MIEPVPAFEFAAARASGVMADRAVASTTTANPAAGYAQVRSYRDDLRAL